MSLEQPLTSLKPLHLPLLQLPTKTQEEIEAQKIDSALAKLSLEEIQIVALKMKGEKQTDIAAYLGVVDSTITVALRRETVKEVMSIYYEQFSSDLKDLLGPAVDNLRKGLKGELNLPNQLESTKVVLKALGKLDHAKPVEASTQNNYYQTLVQIKKEQKVDNAETFKNRRGFTDRTLIDDSR